MDITGHESRETAAKGDAIESAQAVMSSKSIIPGLSTGQLAAAIAIFIAGLFYLGARTYGVPMGSVLNQSISTENALTLYTTMAGIGGFLANIIASSLISTVEGGTVQIGSIILPIAIQITGAVVAAAAFPSGEGSII